MGPSYELKCPHCNSDIEHDDTYDMSTGEDYVIAFCVGHCPNCDREYQWQEEYELKFDGVVNFEEVS